jgi:hypothetical protein
METSLVAAGVVVLGVLIRLLAKFILSRMKAGTTKEMLSSDVFTGDNPSDRPGRPRE